MHGGQLMTHPDRGEFDDLIVARVLEDTAGWAVTITASAVRNSLERLRTEDARLTPEVARPHVWTIFPEPREPVVFDLTDRVIDLPETAVVT